MQNSESMSVTWKYLNAEIGWQTTMGFINKQYPMFGGNSFSFSEGPYCVNMRAENFKEATKRFILDGKVHCILAHNCVFVIDRRVPDDWLCDWDLRGRDFSDEHLEIIEKFIKAYKACEELVLLELELEEINAKLT